MVMSFPIQFSKSEVNTISSVSLEGTGKLAPASAAVKNFLKKKSFFFLDREALERLRDVEKKRKHIGCDLLTSADSVFKTALSSGEPISSSENAAVKREWKKKWFFFRLYEATRNCGMDLWDVRLFWHREV